MKIIITIRVLFSTAVTVHVPLACSNILIRRRAKKMSTEKGLRVNFIFPSLSRLACLGLLVILRWLVGSFNKNTKYGQRSAREKSESILVVEKRWRWQIGRLLWRVG